MNEHIAVRDFITVGNYIKDGTARNLKLLRTISSTITALRTTANEARGFTEMVQDLADTVCSCRAAVPEKIVPVLENLQDSLEELYGLMREKNAAAQRAVDLRPADGVCEAYEDAIEVIRGLHEGIETLRWLVMEHNADLEQPTGGSMSSSEEIERFLLSL